MNWYSVRPHDSYGWKVESFPSVRPHQETRVRRMVDMPDAAERLEPGPMIIIWNDHDRQYGTVYGRHEWHQFDTREVANAWVRSTEAELAALDAPPPFLVIVEANDDVAQRRLETEQDHEAFEQECFDAGRRAFREGTPLHEAGLPRTVPLYYHGDEGHRRVLSGYLATMRDQVFAMTEMMIESSRLRRLRVHRNREEALEGAAGNPYGRSPARSVLEMDAERNPTTYVTMDFAEVERRVADSVGLNLEHLAGGSGGGDSVYDERVETDQIEDQLGAPRGSTRRMIAQAYGASPETIERTEAAHRRNHETLQENIRRRREAARRREPPPDPERDIDL